MASTASALRLPTPSLSRVSLSRQGFSGPILGIDPGVTGALCLLRPDGSSELRDVPTLDVKPRRILDLHALAGILAGWAPERPTCWIELVGPRPTDGCVGAFSFGGMWWGLKAMAVAHGMPLEAVAPIRWRRAVGLQAGDGKDASRARASALLPQMAHHWPLKSHDGRAEAALIALYGQRRAAALATPNHPSASIRSPRP